jgi:hypothetical protein
MRCRPARGSSMFKDLGLGGITAGIAAPPRCAENARSTVVVYKTGPAPAATVVEPERQRVRQRCRRARKQRACFRERFSPARSLTNSVTCCSARVRTPAAAPCARSGARTTSPGPSAAASISPANSPNAIGVFLRSARAPCQAIHAILPAAAYRMKTLTRFA